MRKQKTSRNNGMIKVGCPKCKNAFGLSTSFVEKMAAVNFRYQCPYCKHESGMKES